MSSKFEVAGWLQANLHNAGCQGERAAVKDVLSLLSLREQRLLAKLLGRQIKRSERSSEEG